jgi:copper chaperone CopZ
MKLNIKVIIATFIAIAIIGLVFLLKPATIPSNEDLAITRIQVEGMTCKDCEQSIKKTLKKLNGIYVTEIDHATGKGYIKFDDKKVLEKDILIQINQTGFIVTKRKPIKLQVVDYNVQFQTN